MLYNINVEVDGEPSDFFTQELGCAQGSVLGPLLFTLLLSPLEEVLPYPIPTYADDSNGIISSNTLSEAEEQFEDNIVKHIEWLKDSGLVVNESKTEVMVLHRKHKLKTSIRIGNNTMDTKTEMKILGLTMDQNLKWSKHVEKVTQIGKRSLHGLRVIRKYFTENEFKSILTSSFFNKVSYGSAVWLTSGLDYKSKQKLDSVFIRSLRLLKKDYKNNTSKLTLLEGRKRANFNEFADYSLAKILIGIYNQEKPRFLSEILTRFTYHKRRCPGRVFAYEDSVHKIGRNTINAKSKTILEKMDFDWYKKTLGTHQIRRELKNRFFTYT